MRTRTRAALALLVWLFACSSPEEKAESARQAAREALAKGDGAAALEALGELREAEPDTADAALELAGLLVQAGDAAQAVWVLEDAVPRFPSRDDLALALGRAALLVSDPSRARRAVEAVPAGSELHPNALLVRAQAELLLGDLEASLATFEEAETLYPELPEVRLPRIATLLREHRYADAATALERAKAQAGSAETRAALRQLEVALHRQRGLQKEDREAAIASLSDLVEEEPTDVAAWGALLELLMRDGRAAEGRQRLEAALDADPANLGLLPLLASAHALLGEDAEAEQVLERILAERPSPTAHLALAQFHAGRQHEAAALAALDNGIAAFPDTALLRLSRAEYLIDLERLDEARDELERAEALAAGRPEVEFVRARLELAGGDVEGARARLEAVLPALDSSAAHLWLGRVLEEQGDLEGATRRYGLALARDASDPVPALYLMRVAERRGDWQQAAGAGRLAVQRAPGRFDGWAGVATALMRLGRAKGAEEVAGALLERFPDRVESRLLMAAALRGQGRHAEALAQLEAARERFGASAELAAEEALTRGLAGDAEGGIAAARRGLEADPDSARLHAVLASILYLTGTDENVAEAERATDRALELDPDDPEPYRTRARYRAATGYLAGARADCEAFLAKRPEDAEMLFILGVVHEKQGRPVFAMSAYRRAADADALDFRPRNNLALLLEAQGNLDGAIEFAQEAYRLAEGNPSVMDTLAALYLKKGLVDRSISLLEEARGKAPGKPAVQLHLAMAYRDAGRVDEARSLLLDLRARHGTQPKLLEQVDEAIATLP